MPFKPSERQYRSFAASNFKPIANEANESEPSYKVRGYFTTWNDEYCLYERTKYWPAEYEQIDGVDYETWKQGKKASKKAETEEEFIYHFIKAKQ